MWGGGGDSNYSTEERNAKTREGLKTVPLQKSTDSIHSEKGRKEIRKKENPGIHVWIHHRPSIAISSGFARSVTLVARLHCLRFSNSPHLKRHSWTFLVDAGRVLTISAPEETSCLLWSGDASPFPLSHQQLNPRPACLTTGGSSGDTRFPKQAGFPKAIPDLSTQKKDTSLIFLLLTHSPSSTNPSPS